MLLQLMLNLLFLWEIKSIVLIDYIAQWDGCSLTELVEIRGAHGGISEMTEKKTSFKSYEWLSEKSFADTAFLRECVFIFGFVYTKYHLLGSYTDVTQRSLAASCIYSFVIYS